jgi:hypothetical protein
MGEADEMIMRYQMKYPMIPVVAAIGVSITALARADQAAVAFDTTQLWGLDGGVGMFGWQFTTRSEIQVSALELYDGFTFGFPGDGLSESHAIAIWDVSNHSTPLVSALIPSGTGAPLINGFRYVSTPQVTLSGGHSYVIAALYSTTQDRTTGAVNNPGFVLTVSPPIAFSGYQWSSSSTLAFPPNNVPGQLFAFGPNFMFSQVPEPSTVTLCAVGASAFLGSRKRLRHRRTRQALAG